MTFDDMLNQVITLLKRQGRVSYRALPGMVPRGTRTQ